MKDTLGLIFAYQNDELMNSLTQKRALSSIPFGGRYRVVDFALSSMVNSGITKVGIITRDNYQSLMDHLGNGKEWDLSRKNGGLYILPPFAQSSGYRGKMEALRNAEAFIRKSTEEYVVLSSADCIFNMKYDDALKFHKDKGADITIIYKKQTVSKFNEGAGAGNILMTDEDGRVTDVAINPEVGEEEVLRSMEQIIISRKLLESLIHDCASHYMYSFHRDVLQRHLKDLKIYGYSYDGYYAKIDSVASYYSANMQLLEGDVRRELFYHQNQQIYTKIRDEAPTLYQGESKVLNSIIADGCVIEGTVENSILFRGVKVAPGAVIKDSIVMQDTQIESGATLSFTVLDKDVIVREGCNLCGNRFYPMVLPKGSDVK